MTSTPPDDAVDLAAKARTEAARRHATERRSGLPAMPPSASGTGVFDALATIEAAPSPLAWQGLRDAYRAADADLAALDEGDSRYAAASADASARAAAIAADPTGDLPAPEHLPAWDARREALKARVDALREATTAAFLELAWRVDAAETAIVAAAQAQAARHRTQLDKLLREAAVEVEAIDKTLGALALVRQIVEKPVDGTHSAPTGARAVPMPRLAGSPAGHVAPADALAALAGYRADDGDPEEPAAA